MEESKIKTLPIMQDLLFVLFTWKKHYPHKIHPDRFMRIWGNFKKIKEIIQKTDFDNII